MRPEALAALSTLDLASFEALTTELIRAGFEPVAGSDLCRWEGPIADAFKDLSWTRSCRSTFVMDGHFDTRA